MLRLDFLVLVLQSSNSFNLKVFFQFFVCLFPGPYSKVAFRGRVFLWAFLKGREFCFCSFFRLKFSNCFHVEAHVFERSFIFCTFVCTHGALKFRLIMVALPASLIMSTPAKIT